METIADRLNAVKQVKTDIKTAIAEKGLDMEGVPFTQYAEKVAMIGATEIIPLVVMEGGTYTAPEGKAFNPVTVERALKKYFDETGESGGVFAGCQVVDMSLLVEYNDTENVTSCQNMYANCTKTKYFPLLDTGKNTRMYYMHNNNYEMVEVPFYNTVNVIEMQQAFGYCRALKKIPAFDCRNVYTFNRVFVECSSLEEICIRNIVATLQVGSGTAWGHLLTVESLIHLIKELRQTKSKLILTMGNANLAKLANVYVRKIDITDEMRAEDDLIDEKLPFEVCESTDDEAMLITDYVALKNWTLA